MTAPVTFAPVARWSRRDCSLAAGRCWLSIAIHRHASFRLRGYAELRRMATTLRQMHDHIERRECYTHEMFTPRTGQSLSLDYENGLIRLRRRLNDAGFILDTSELVEIHNWLAAFADVEPLPDPCDCLDSLALEQVAAGVLFAVADARPCLLPAHCAPGLQLRLAQSACSPEAGKWTFGDRRGTVTFSFSDGRFSLGLLSPAAPPRTVYLSRAGVVHLARRLGKYLLATGVTPPVQLRW